MWTVTGGLLIVALVASVAWAAGERPTEADLADCARYASAQTGRPSYVERAPTSPFPNVAAAVGVWTGPITGPRAEAPSPAAPESIDSPSASGLFGLGGQSQESITEPGWHDPRFKEAFDACMHARGF